MSVLSCVSVDSESGCECVVNSVDDVYKCVCILWSCLLCGLQFVCVDLSVGSIEYECVVMCVCCIQCKYVVMGVCCIQCEYVVMCVCCIQSF